LKPIRLQCELSALFAEQFTGSKITTVGRRTKTIRHRAILATAHTRSWYPPCTSPTFVVRPALAPGITDSSTRLVLTPEHARLSFGTDDVAAPVEESSQIASAGAG